MLQLEGLNKERAIQKGAKIVAVLVLVIALIIISRSLVKNVRSGTYQIKQSLVTGDMSAKMTPGMWLQMFGDITVWPTAETFYFTSDPYEGKKHDQSIEVRFNDGSVVRISGTMRVIMPVVEKDAVNLVVKYGFKSYDELEHKLILPIVRNALRLSANLMSARESYSERRPDFIHWTWDQVQNGLYETEDIEKEVYDPITAEKSRRTFKVVKKDQSGKPIYQVNPMAGLGIQVANFEVKQFVYPKNVEEQISTQQNALMSVATARTQVQQAEQEKLKAKALGEAAVTRAQYEEEEKRIKAVVVAKTAKDVAEIGLQAAELEKKRLIALGEGEAARKQLIMEADGALEQKLAVLKEVLLAYANVAGRQKWVPDIVMGGASTTQAPSAMMDFLNIVTLKAAKDLAVDLSLKDGPAASTKGAQATPKNTPRDETGKK